ncbi:MAG: hypothetical protein H0W61_01960 [Bacteroidetes bacterium]|nr:hypothetical protein [Bacteroidota bacterium]
MKRYRHRGGNSGVRSYEIGETFIKIQFGTGEIYLYDYERPGRVQVEKMKILAEAGKGLSTFISKHVKENFSEKLS